MNAAISRRELLMRFFQRGTRKEQARRSEGSQSRLASAATRIGETDKRVAVIQGRFCLALTSFCSVCVERCPVPGAMRKERGVPMVVSDLCTGCGVCQEVCPAPRNAVLLLPDRHRNSSFSSSSTSSSSNPQMLKAQLP